VKEKNFFISMDCDQEELQLMNNALVLYKFASKLFKRYYNLEVCDYLHLKINDYKTEDVSKKKERKG